MLATFFIGNGPLIVALVLIVILLIIIIANIRIVPQASVYVIERLGTFSQEWHTGPHFLVPFLDRVANVRIDQILNVNHRSGFSLPRPLCGVLVPLPCSTWRWMPECLV